MLNTLSKLKKSYWKKSVKITIAVMFIFLVFGIIRSVPTNVVKAFNNQIKIIPDIVLVEGLKDNTWKAENNTLVQDLNSDAEFEEFNSKNSAFYILEQTATEGSSPDAEVKDQEPKQEEPVSGLKEMPVVNGEPAVEEQISPRAVPPSAQLPDISPAKIFANPFEEIKNVNDAVCEDLPDEKAPEAQGINEGSTPQSTEDASGQSQPGSLSPTAPSSEPITPSSDQVPSDSNPSSFLFDLDELYDGFTSKISRIFKLTNAHAENLDTVNTESRERASLVFSNFTIPGKENSESTEQIKTVTASMSFAGKSASKDTHVLVEYKTGEEWKTGASFPLLSGISNELNRGYFSIPLSDVDDWKKIENLSIKISIVDPGVKKSSDQDIEAYLDALWIDVEYDSLDDQGTEFKEQEEPTDDFIDDKQETSEPEDNGPVKLISETKDFKTSDAPEFNFIYRRKPTFIKQLVSFFNKIIGDEYRNVSYKTEIFDDQGKKTDLGTTIHRLDNGEFEVRLDGSRRIKPGKYKLKIRIEDSGDTIFKEQDFTWGVLAFNADKAVYRPGEEAFLQMAVLDDLGHTICNAELLLEITPPAGEAVKLSTENGGITRNGECGPDNVIDFPDYFGYLKLEQTGEYRVSLTAETENGIRTVTDKLEVSEGEPFEIEREGPTRIYPLADYKMRISFTAKEDFEGTIKEMIPAAFELIKQEIKFDENPGGNEQGSLAPLEAGFRLGTSENADEKVLEYSDIKLKKGDKIEISYLFDAPDISPEFYLLGPLRFIDKDGKEKYAEKRQWQIASDAPIQSLTVENMGVVSNNDLVSWKNVLVATSTSFTAGNKYFIYVTAGFTGSTNAVNVSFQVLYGTTTVYSGQMEPGNGSANQAYQMQWFDVYDQPAAATSVTLRFRPVSGTAYSANAQIYAINLGSLSTADWKYGTSTTLLQHTTSATSFANVTLDQANGAKDWLVFAMEDVIIDAVNAQFNGQIYDGTGAYMRYSREGENANEQFPYVLFRTFTDVATNTNFSIQVFDETTNNDHNASKVFALNLDAFESHKSYYSDTDVPLSPDYAYTEVGNLDQGGYYAPAQSGDQFIFSAFINNAQDAAASTNDRLMINGATSSAEWNWYQSAGLFNYRTTYDAQDDSLHTIAAKQNFPITGYPIRLEAVEIAAASQISSEVSITAFSASLRHLEANAYQQYKSDGVTSIANGGYSNSSDMMLNAISSNISSSTNAIEFYFELIGNSGTATTSTGTPPVFCPNSAEFDSCSPKVWKASNSLEGWYDSGWLYRKKLTINAGQVVADAADFPVLATTTDPDFAYTSFGGHMASSTGADIVITDSSGTTSIPYEREHYASSTGQIVLWIKSDISSTTNTVLYMYYGNSGLATSLATTTGAWDDNYLAVWHLDESGSAISDSASEIYTGTKGAAAAAPAQTAGQAGYAQYFDGADYINFGDVLDAGTSDWTVEVWYQPTIVGTADNGILYNKETLYEAAGGGNMHRFAWQPGWAWYGSGFTTSINNWYYGVVRYDHARQYMYKNGDWVYDRVQTGDIGSNAEILQIGRRANAGGSSYFTGRIDEVRISNIARSPAWIKTSHNNMGNAGAFLSFDSEDPLSDHFEGIASITSIPDSSVGYKWQAKACDDQGDCSVWDAFNTSTPNFKIDTLPPQAPGNLSVIETDANSVRLDFGYDAVEANFDKYRIFYRQGSSGAVETDSEHTDPSLDEIDYDGASETTIAGLAPDTQYVANIWAYDLAGNKAAASEVTFFTGEAGRAKTVEFFAGSYTSDGIDGQLANTYYTLPGFNFSLAENSANIRNAYIVFEAQLDAYSDLRQNVYYTLNFDACQEPCAANATSGPGRIQSTDATPFYYYETSDTGIQGRILIDVTDEIQLEGYGGGGVMEGQVGYQFDKINATSSIANAKAKLVLTYTYNKNSPSYTNTVVYPLEFESGTGTKPTVQADGCLPNVNCPVFYYNAVIPEYITSQSPASLSQWFQTYNSNYGHGGNDVYIDVNIQGVDATSTQYVHESFQGGAQSIMPAVYFQPAGYAPNSSQALEYHANAPIGGSYYFLLGGELVDTYIASTSASVKTRTVSLPMGVVSNGLSYDTSEGSVDVFFPENGADSGKIEIQKAWLRILGSNYYSTSTGFRIEVSTKTGDNATSSISLYQQNAGGALIKPSYNIIHLLSDSDLGQLEAANASEKKTVKVTMRHQELNYELPPAQGGFTAELMITYTYTDENSGYLASLKVMGGQPAVAGNSQQSTTTFYSVLPEATADKTILAAGVLAGYLYSDSDHGVPSVYVLDANISTGIPVCANAFNAPNDSTNGFIEFMKSVTSAFTALDNQAYTVCFSNNGGSDPDAGAKMNGEIVYTYLYINPSTLITSADDQLKADVFTSIPNQNWTTEDQVNLGAVALDTSSSTRLEFVFELIGQGDAFSSTTPATSTACTIGTGYEDCASKHWIASADSSSDWYDSGWPYRKKLTINAGQVVADAADFPVLATTTDPDFAYTSFGGHMASSTGADIVITDSSGTTSIPYEREHYASSTGQIVLWIKSDISSTTNTVLYMYYGNSGLATSLATTTGAWDDNYLAVWHLDESGSAISDSASEIYTGTKGAAAAAPAQTAGQAGYAQYFDGADYINFGDVLDAGTSDWTVEVWYQPTIVGTADNGILYNKETLYEAAGGGNMHRFAWQPGWAWYGSGFTTSINNWYYGVVRYDHARQYMYKNGDWVYDRVQTGDIEFNAEILQIGRRANAGGSSYFTGRIDEVRISNIARSPAWIKTSHNNQAGSANFISFASTEDSIFSRYIDRTANIADIPDSADGYKWQVFACNSLGQCTDWDTYDTPPNFKVDTLPPTAPGDLLVATMTPTTATLIFGGQTSDINFARYRVFYKEGLAGATEADIEKNDGNLLEIDYHGATSTRLTTLQSATQYVANIWAYDLAGNKTSASELQFTTPSAPHQRANTVRFPGGIYSGNGTNGQNSDTDHVFSPSSIQLAEHQSVIRNAYLVFESQFEAYRNTVGSYNGYRLAFDACEEPCIADAFSGDGRILYDEATVLAFDETESNFVRLLLDVTEEAQLAEYAGGSAILEGQIGYQFKNGQATSSIASAKAMLYVTYAFNNDDSASFTNTIVYPLESSQAGDSGTRRNPQPDDCTLDSSCPTYAYNVEAPEASIKISQWFENYLVNTGNGGNDIRVNVNLQNRNLDSGTYIHEAYNATEQGHFPQMVFPDVQGFSTGTLQSLEYHAWDTAGTGTYFMMGGETAYTYLASTSAGTKTRTASFPIGVINSGQSIALASGTANIYFPENGSGSGVVDIKKAWFRVIGNYRVNSGDSLILSSKVGDNPQSGNYQYHITAGGAVIKPSFNVIHVIPSADYAELEFANASTSKAVSIMASNGSANLGGVSAELMVTYTYTSETTGYLSSLSLYGGQAGESANTKTVVVQTGESVFPELRGSKTLLAGALLPSYLLSSSDGSMPAAWATLDAHLGLTSETACANSFRHSTDGVNSFSEFYRDIVVATTTLDTTDSQAYYSCIYNDGCADAYTGAKMNAQIKYTYFWAAPPTEYTQKDWRWYENADAIQPTVPKAAEKTSISGFNLADTVRLRMNVGVSREDLATSTQNFKLQFGLGSNCSDISDWTDAGGTSGNEAWIGYNNIFPNDGSGIVSPLLSSSTVAETYEESNPSSNNSKAIPAGEFGEWDWVLYNNSATSSSQYCFRMALGSGNAFEDYLPDSYPIIITASSNTPPASASALNQYSGSSGTTTIANAGWINTDSIRLTSAAADPNINELVTLYFQFIQATGSLMTATTAPASPCISGTAYAACASKVWAVTSALGDYRTIPFTATASIITIPHNGTGYQWQVISCDDGGVCASSWSNFGISPNIRVDLIPPTPPGQLVFASSTATSIRLDFGATSTEEYFSIYKIFYKAGFSGVTESNTQHSDSNLSSITFNGAASATIVNLSAGSGYVFNIWAYDQAGNKASATLEAVGTTTSSFTPPTGSIWTVSQKTDGSGAIDVVISADDADNDDTLRAKIEYKEGSSCDFSTSSDPTLDTADANTTADKGDPEVDNSSEYQIGTTSGWILTSPGQNFISFDWLSKADIPNVNGTYCLKYTVSDGLFVGASTTRQILIDNVAPSVPGALTLNQNHYDRLVLNYGGQSFDPSFSRYRIFYKQGTSGASENDTEHSDTNLLVQNFNLKTTTTISNLRPNTQYTVNIWAYDINGNRASSTEFSIKTNAAPMNMTANNQFKSNGTTMIANTAWTEEDMVKLYASAHDQDASETLTFYFNLTTATGTFVTATSVPSGACASTTPYLSCPAKTWSAATTTGEVPASWYHKNWPYRKIITINSSKVESSQSGFPVLATTTDSDLAAKARSDGFDIMFTAADGTTTLAFEREYYDPGTGQLVAWVKTDISSASNTILYMYYGNANETSDRSTTTGVWDSEFKGVWHLQESVVDEGSQSGAHIDSTASSNHGSQYGNNEYSQRIYRGQEFDGNDYIEVSDSASLDMSSRITLGGWFNVNAGTNWKYKRTITLSTSTPLSSYQVKVNLTASSFNYNKARADGSDIRFYDTSESSLSYWIETWNTSGTSTLWVRIPSAGTSQFHMYYGNESAASQSSGSSTFNFFDDFSGSSLSSVWQADANNYAVSGGALRINVGAVGMVNPLSFNLNSGYVLESRVQYHDSVGAYSGTLSGQSSRYTQGSNAGADATNLYMRNGATQPARWTGSGSAGSYDCGNGNVGTVTSNGAWYILSSAFDSAGVVLSRDRGAGSSFGCGWIKNINYISLGAFLGGASTDYQDTSYDWVLARRYYSGGEPTATLGSESGAGIVKDGAYSIITGTSTVAANINSITATSTINAGWNHIMFTYDKDAGSSQLKLYINGALSGTASSTSSISSNSSNLLFGYLLNGVMDEVWLSNTARSAQWIKTAYNNQSSVSGFLSFGSESQTTSYYETILALDIPDSLSGYKWQVMACDDDGDCTNWQKFNIATPNFKVDATAPTAPGALSENTKTSNSITLNFGSQTAEANFLAYKIFYSTNTPVWENNTEHGDADLSFINYNNTYGTEVTGLIASTTYFFNIWAYDQVGNKASSTAIQISTQQPQSSPGVMFYAKNSQAIRYRVWDGIAWGAERIGPNMGSDSSTRPRHIRTVTSDDKGKVAVFVKSWNATTTSQEYWATVYRFAADDFVDTQQLESTVISSTNDEELTGCIASLSGKDYFILLSRYYPDGATSTQVYSWNAADGWSSEGAGPYPGGGINACELVRRPGTDEYVLMMFDDASDSNSSYYKGGPTYSDNWDMVTEHGIDAYNNGNYAGGVYFDPSNNSRGAISYKASNTIWTTEAKYFEISGLSSMSFGSASTSQTVWTDSFVHGEFAANPGSSGAAYYAGRDIDERLSVLKMDISGGSPAWTAVANGSGITDTGLYGFANYSQKPFSPIFYKANKGVLLWNSSVATANPYYNIIDASANSVFASTTIPGSTGDQWTRVRTYDDPNEDEFLAVFQNDNIDYSAVFWDGANDRFYNSVANPGSGQVWTALATSTGIFDRDNEATSFSFASFNSPPDSPGALFQYRADGTTAISNDGWTNESAVKLKAGITDPDSSEALSVYFQLVTATSTFATSTAELNGACASTTPYLSCDPKIWVIATSSMADYSISPFSASTTVSGVPDSSAGYKWQVVACDDGGTCSLLGWSKFNLATPNFKVDTVLPTSPGALIITNKNSYSATIQFGAQTTEANFYRYRIFFATGTIATEYTSEQIDADLNSKTYGGTTNTVVINLASGTQYYFNIWAYDYAGNKASATPQVATTTNSSYSLSQTSYLLENDDGADVNNNTAETAADTALSGLFKGERLLARVQVHNFGGDIATSKIYKLQFENQTDAPGVWSDVTSTTSISYSYGFSGANGNAISSSKATMSTSTMVFGTWHENANTTGSFSLNYGFFTEFVFAVKTDLSTLGKTYRLRLLNLTDNSLLGYYNYPTFSIRNTETIKYSKNISAALPTTSADLQYYFDPQGYGDVATDDGTRDSLTSSSNYPVINFATKNNNNTNAITVSWNGQSSADTSGAPLYLQVFKYGSPDQWVTVASNATTTANNDFTISANINSSLASYYDGNFWSYWRVYQGTGSQIIRTDLFSLATSTPVPYVKQSHFRWRYDDGSQTAATWRETEDVGDPTGVTPPLNKGETVRLRFSIANTGGGAAAGYAYRIEYATSTGSCSAIQSWSAVGTSSSLHWLVATSSNYAYADATTNSCPQTVILLRQAVWLSILIPPHLRLRSAKITARRSNMPSRLPITRLPQEHIVSGRLLTAQL